MISDPVKARAAGPPSRQSSSCAFAKAFDKRVICIDGAEATSEIRTFRKATATRRKAWEAKTWPQGLIPIGDALSSVNPTYGQGMTVAACEADALAGMLDKRAETDAGLDGLVAEYLPAAGDIAARAWACRSLRLRLSEMRRAASNFDEPRHANTLRKLAAEDLEFRMFRLRLVHIIENANALRDGPLAVRFFTALQGSITS
jgi:2-polyprenyl-6-methoxyphenol hydroxylase-like FAD-dependent oxidoreductase